MLHVVFLERRKKGLAIVGPEGLGAYLGVWGNPGAEGTHNHVGDGADGLADDLLGVTTLAPVSCGEVAPVGVVAGNDAEPGLLGGREGGREGP